MSQKTAKRIRRLEEDVRILKTGADVQERRVDAWDAAVSAIHNQGILDAAECSSARHRAKQAERVAATWRTLTYAALVAAIVIEVIAILAVHAASADTTPELATSAAVPEPQTVQEDFENELIEAALLAQAHVIEDCVVTHYDCCIKCCGKDDGITASGVQATPGVTVAVDPNVIPLGADVLVDYGDGEIHYYRADDLGPIGDHIDLCVASHDEALQLGRRTATVYWVAQEEVTGNAA